MTQTRIPLQLKPLWVLKGCDPDASDKTLKSFFTKPRSNSSQIPFHLSTNNCHQMMSALADIFSLTRCLGWVPNSYSVYSLRRNGLPGRATLQANCKSSVILSISFFWNLGMTNVLYSGKFSEGLIFGNFGRKQ